MPSQFPRDPSRRFDLREPLAWQKRHAWDTSGPAGLCEGKRIGLFTIDASTDLQPICAITAPCPVSRWTLYVVNLGKSVRSANPPPQDTPPEMRLVLRVGADYACDDAAAVVWTPTAFNEGQRIVTLSGLVGTTVELWGRVNPADPNAGSVQFNPRLLIDDSSSDSATPVLNLGPNVA